jgi:hypothetical protein
MNASNRKYILSILAGISGCTLTYKNRFIYGSGEVPLFEVGNKTVSAKLALVQYGFFPDGCYAIFSIGLAGGKSSGAGVLFLVRDDGEAVACFDSQDTLIELVADHNGRDTDLHVCYGDLYASAMVASSCFSLPACEYDWGVV